jgi:dihydroflavonol-4-reductase
MRIAVTGATGLIGAHVVRAAVAAGDDTTAVVRSYSRRDGFDVARTPIAVADVLGPMPPLVNAFSGAETVIHTAATFAFGGDAEALHRVAVQGTENVLRAAAAAGVRRVVVTSSAVVFGYSSAGEVIDDDRGLADTAGQPAYVIAKIEQDRLALDLADRLGLELVLPCPTMSIGETASALGPSNALIVTYLTDPTRSTYPGGCNLVAAADVGEAHVMLAKAGESGAHYLLGSENLLWSQIHARIGVLAGVGGPHWEIGANVAVLAARSQTLLSLLSGRASLSSVEQANMMGRYYWYDHSRAAALGYRPRSVVTALIEAVSWLAASAHIPREARASMHLAEAVHRFRYDEIAQ